MSEERDDRRTACMARCLGHGPMRGPIPHGKLTTAPPRAREENAGLCVAECMRPREAGESYAGTSSANASAPAQAPVLVAAARLRFNIVRTTPPSERTSVASVIHIPCANAGE